MPESWSPFDNEARPCPREEMAAAVLFSALLTVSAKNMMIPCRTYRWSDKHEWEPDKAAVDSSIVLMLMLSLAGSGHKYPAVSVV